MTAAARPLAIRLTHWLNVVAIVPMAGSGMAIYNASPFLPFEFPQPLLLGGWLGASIAWHFAVMWMLVGNAVIYLSCGLCSGYLRRTFLPLSLAPLLKELSELAAGRITHATGGGYGMIQRLSYLAVLLAGVLMLLSGLVLWKPVQFGALEQLLGGYEFARRLHLLGMAVILAFAAVHLAMVALMPQSLRSMLWRAG